MSVIKCQCAKPAKYVACFANPQGKVRWREICGQCLDELSGAPISVVHIGLATAMLDPRVRNKSSMTDAEVIADIKEVMRPIRHIIDRPDDEINEARKLLDDGKPVYLLIDADHEGAEISDQSPRGYMYRALGEWRTGGEHDRAKFFEPEDE